MKWQGANRDYVKHTASARVTLLMAFVPVDAGSKFLSLLVGLCYDHSSIPDEATTSLNPDIMARIREKIRGLSGRLTVLAISRQPTLAKIIGLNINFWGGKGRDGVLSSCVTSRSTSISWRLREDNES